MVKNLPAMQETWVRSLCREHPLKGGHGNPLQYSRLENTKDREAWRSPGHVIAESNMTELRANLTPLCTSPILSSLFYCLIQFSSVSQSLCDSMDCNMPSLPVHHQLPESTQTHVHWVGDAIQPSHLLSAPSPPVFSLSQHQGLFKWVSSSHQMAEVLEFQLQHWSFQWTLRTDFL